MISVDRLIYECVCTGSVFLAMMPSHSSYREWFVAFYLAVATGTALLFFSAGKT
jgi:hypothetical protein